MGALRTIAGIVLIVAALGVGYAFGSGTFSALTGGKGTFILKRASDRQYHFTLVAPNGEVIAQSERDTSKAAALNGIRSIRKHAGGATEIDCSAPAIAALRDCQ